MVAKVFFVDRGNVEREKRLCGFCGKELKEKPEKCPKCGCVLLWKTE